MATSFHGIEQATPDHEGHFHFAVGNFFLTLHYMYFGVRAASKQPPPWPDKWLDATFCQACMKLADTFAKVDVVARLLGRAHHEVGEFKGAKQLEQYFRHLDALKTIPIYLDIILVYLRIFADCLANLTPNLYGQSGKVITKKYRESFHKHRNWFKSKRNTLDPTYANILDQHTNWFDILAGEKGKGLRDIDIHFRGIFQLSYTVDTAPNQTEILAGLYGDKGWVDSDVLQTLKDLVADLFLFLDHYVTHFNEKVRQEIGCPPLDLGKPHSTEYIRLTKPIVLDSFWLYPNMERRKGQCA